MKDQIKNLFNGFWDKIAANPFAALLTLNAIAAIVIIIRMHTPADRVRENLGKKINKIEAESQKAKSQVDSLKVQLLKTKSKLQTAIELIKANELLNEDLTATYYQNKKTKQADVDTIVAYLRLVQSEQKKLTK